jgi:hypothetical protein
VNLEALVRPELDAGVKGSAQLLEFAAAVIGPDRARLNAARDALAGRLSPATVTGASAIAGNFSKNDRIADAVGIPIDPNDLEPTRVLRAELGLNDFKSAANTFRHFADT